MLCPIVGLMFCDWLQAKYSNVAPSQRKGQMDWVVFVTPHPYCSTWGTCCQQQYNALRFSGFQWSNCLILNSTIDQKNYISSGAWTHSQLVADVIQSKPLLCCKVAIQVSFKRL